MTHGTGGPRSLSEKFYWLFLLVVGLGGAALIGLAAWGRHDASDEANAAILSQLQQAAPSLRSAEASQILSALRDWQGRLAHESLTEIVLRDLGIAMVVAVFLTIVIETYARNRLQDEVRSGVVEAAFARLIPPMVFEQVRQHVMGARVAKEHWVIEMVVRPGPAEMESGCYISRTVLRYHLRSLTGRSVKESFSVGLDQDVTGKDVGGKPLPRFESVTLGATQYREADLVARLSNDGLCFEEKNLVIGAHPLSVTVVLEEIIRVPDTFIWSTRHCTNGATLTIDASSAPELRFEITALHPDADALQTLVTGRTWEFRNGILPWQGFQVRSERIPLQEGQVGGAAGGAVGAPELAAPALAATGADAPIGNADTRA